MNPLYPQRHFARYRPIVAVLVLILSLVSFGAHAQELTDSTIRSFVTTLEEAQAMEPEFEELNNTGNNETLDLSRIFSSAVEEMEGEEIYGRLEDLVQKNGFRNLGEWATMGDRIYRAWIAIEMKNQSPEFEKEMRSAMAEMDNNPHMSAEQKAQIRASMQTALGLTQKANDAPPADIEAVKPHMEALRAIANVEED